MPSLSDLTRAWLLRQLGLSASNLSEADLQTALYGANPVAGPGLASNMSFASGRYYGPSLDVSTGTIAAVLDRMWVVPFEVGQTTRFDRIATEVTTVGTTGNLGRLGIYGTTNGLPGSLVLDAGTFDATILGGAEKVIDQQLTPGLYWLAFVSQIGVAANIRALGSAASRFVGHDSNPLSNGYKSYRVNGVSGALPNPFGIPVADTSAPKIFMRAA